MERPSSFFLSTIFFTLTIFFIVVAELLLGNALNWPIGIYIAVTLAASVLCLKYFLGLFNLFKNFDTQDQRVIGIAIFVFLAFFSLAIFSIYGTTYSPLLSNFSFGGLLFLPWLILFLYGSEKVKQGISTESFRNASTQDKMVILVASLARIACIVSPSFMGSKVDSPLFWVLVLIAAFIHIPIFIVFGSSTLRNTVIPKWLKAE